MSIKLIIELGVAAAAIVLIAWYLGLWVKLVVTERKVGPFNFVYHSMNPLEAATQMTASLNIKLMLKKFGIREARQFTVFPAKIIDADTTGKFGWVVPSQHRARLHTIPGVQVEHIPSSPCMVVDFPRGGMMASTVGYLRAKRVLERYRRSHGYRETNIYLDRLGDKTMFAQPIQRATSAERAAEQT